MIGFKWILDDPAQGQLGPQTIRPIMNWIELNWIILGLMSSKLSEELVFNKKESEIKIE